MEIFNTALNQLVEKKQKNKNVIVKQKDYSSILNTIMHMVEDKNMLVFLEAIKTVELLATLLGQAMVKT
jgi:ABC-type phosphate/phosphonate transport system ATPase subunit